MGHKFTKLFKKKCFLKLANKTIKLIVGLFYHRCPQRVTLMQTWPQWPGHEADTLRCWQVKGKEAHVEEAKVASASAGVVHRTWPFMLSLSIYHTVYISLSFSLINIMTVQLSAKFVFTYSRHGFTDLRMQKKTMKRPPLVVRKEVDQKISGISLFK